MRSGTGTKSGEPGVVTFVDECDDGLLGRAVVPRGQRVIGASAGGGECHRSEERGSDEIKGALGFHGFGSLANKRIASPVKSRAGHPASPRDSQAGRYLLPAPGCICSKTLLMLKLPVAWLGGKSLNVASILPTTACAGTRTNAWSINQS